jgi:membrane-associated phospholipid phosphatase
VVLASGVSAQAHSIRWWEAAIAVGAVSVASVFDHNVDAWVQHQRSSHSDAVAGVFRHGGQPEVVFGVGGGMWAAGALGGRPKLRRSGARVLASVVAAGVATAALKIFVGRLRPDITTDQYVFRPFSREDAFPSGHATVAFAFASSLATEIHRPWASALLYAGAVGTAWSRLNDQKHWLSDVLAGATVGITAANVIEGRWRIFGLRPPRFLVDPHGARLQWSAAF